MCLFDIKMHRTICVVTLFLSVQLSVMSEDEAPVYHICCAVATPVYHVCSAVATPVYHVCCEPIR